MKHACVFWGVVLFQVSDLCKRARLALRCVTLVDGSERRLFFQALLIVLPFRRSSPPTFSLHAFRGKNNSANHVAPHKTPACGHDSSVENGAARAKKKITRKKSSQNGNLRVRPVHSVVALCVRVRVRVLGLAGGGGWCDDDGVVLIRSSSRRGCSHPSPPQRLLRRRPAGAAPPHREQRRTDERRRSYAPSASREPN